jgi:hypothetical protein
METIISREKGEEKMTERQLEKAKGHMKSLIFQTEVAIGKMGKSRHEQIAVERLKMARDSLKDAADELEKVHPMQPVQIPQRRTEVWKQRRYDEAHPIVKPEPKPAPPSQPMCRYLTKVLDEYGTIIEKRCKVHMDMEYCGENCPYSTNVAYKTRSKPYLEKGI